MSKNENNQNLLSELRTIKFSCNLRKKIGANRKHILKSYVSSYTPKIGLMFLSTLASDELQLQGSL